MTDPAALKLLDVLQARARSKRIQTLQRQADKDHAAGLHETARGSELLIEALKRQQAEQEMKGEPRP